MELWIRSQKNINIDSRLLMATEIALDYCGENDGYFVLADSIEVAYYNTEERALEVLDEIHEKLKIIMTNEAGADYILVRHLVPIIYEMPEE